MDYLSLFLFFFIICSKIIPLTLFKLGQGFNLHSNYVVFISTEGIIKYDPQTKEETQIIDFGTSINGGEKYISFAQFPSDDNDYFFCRIKLFIYAFSQDFEILGNLTDNDIAKSFVELVPFKSKEEELYLSSVFANEAQNLELKLYKFNYPNSSGDLFEYKAVKVQSKLRQSSYNENVMNKRVSCEITYSSEYTCEVLTCFLMNEQSLFLVINFLYHFQKIKYKQLEMSILLVKFLLIKQNAYLVI